MKTFNLLDQAHAVQALLNAAIEALPRLGEKHSAALIEAIGAFETTAALTTWGVVDVEGRDEGANNLTDDEKRAVINDLVHSHECAEDDWLRIDYLIERVVEERE